MINKLRDLAEYLVYNSLGFAVLLFVIIPGALVLLSLWLNGAL